ncbi:hypothetical protein CDAR_86791 [Caerostris darwini]|uniref:Uncharacterized protein n=1 Tax=Caerostris darwini TaxID=1538125 RepID=A0AAV4VNF1_9ARAC|nr:hypothetical protein CDAR_86791 [Caerostris darwini]
MAVQCSEFESIELDALLEDCDCSEETGNTGQPTFQHSLPCVPSGNRHLNPWTTPSDTLCGRFRNRAGECVSKHGLFVVRIYMGVWMAIIVIVLLSVFQFTPIRESGRALEAARNSSLAPGPNSI